MRTSNLQRRYFLSTLAVFTAGVALNTRFLPAVTGVSDTPGLSSLWKIFCERHRAEKFSGNIPVTGITPCKGHEYTEGQACFFPGLGVCIRPVWIFWKSNSRHPSDALFHWFNEGGSVIVLNQYELKALLKNDAVAHHIATANPKAGKNGVPLAKTRIGAQNKITHLYC